MKIIQPQSKDLGDNFLVRRILPSVEARHAGPFVFLDHFGPKQLVTGEEMVVRAHPHIGLATISYLYKGAILHRDSLGTEEMILPYEVNWMTAGRGIVHSERSKMPADGNELEGIQAWVALPVSHEEVEPEFFHYDSKDIPVIENEQYILRIIAGNFLDHKSPVKVYSDLFYVDLETKGNSLIDWGKFPEQELGIYISKGSLKVNGEEIPMGTFVFFPPKEHIEFEIQNKSRYVILGGKPFPEKRNLFWNFVSSSQQKIEAAKILWDNDGFAKVPNEIDRIPLPK
ncbi:MAG: pirin family protein [Leptospira sp.]|nr:pirin family protein [Leptospira sp.]